jgi:hypothetical protein
MDTSVKIEHPSDKHMMKKSDAVSVSPSQRAPTGCCSLMQTIRMFKSGRSVAFPCEFLNVFPKSGDAIMYHRKKHGAWAGFYIR